MEIDLCFALNGPHVPTMLPIVMETMFHHNEMDGVQLHFVDKGCAPSVIGWIRSHHPAAIIHDHPEKAPDIVSGGDQIVRDVYETMQWMVDYCGKNEWVFLSHFDLEYRGPLLDYYRGLIGPYGAQIGAHATGLVGYSRSKLAVCDVGFEHAGPFFVIRETDTGFPLWKIRHEADPRCTNHDMPISGWDVGELMELRLLSNNGIVLSETETALQRFRVHNGAGCGRCVESNNFIHSQTLATLARLGLEAIA